MTRLETKWAWFCLAVLAANVAVPFGMKGILPHPWGAFLFWCATSVIVIAAGFAVMSLWGKRSDSSCR